MTRGELQLHGKDMASELRPPDFHRVTGGSTAQPVRLPAWGSETSHTELELWAGRSWHGISPRDRTFLLWGHSHLFGEGLRARLKEATRKVKDRLIGYRRFSTYDLDEARLREAAERLLTFRPDYVVGASVALAMLAEANRDLAERFKALRLKAVIATAEAFPTPEARDVVADVLGCPVVLEYGCIESGILAYSSPIGDGFKTMWQSNIVEALPGPNGRHRVIITSLFPRCMPLLRYDVGDELDAGLAADAHEPSVLEFAQLAGRSNDTVVLPSGRRIHSGAFSQAIRDLPNVGAYQVLCKPGTLPRVLIVPQHDNVAALPAAVRTRLSLLDRDLEHVDVLFEPAVRQTRAGKRPMVFMEAS